MPCEKLRLYYAVGFQDLMIQLPDVYPSIREADIEFSNPTNQDQFLFVYDEHDNLLKVVNESEEWSKWKKPYTDKSIGPVVMNYYQDLENRIEKELYEIKKREEARKRKAVKRRAHK